MGGTNGEADLGLSTAYRELPRFNAPRWQRLTVEGVARLGKRDRVVLLLPGAAPAYMLAHVTDDQMLAAYGKDKDFQKEVLTARNRNQQYERSKARRLALHGGSAASGDAGTAVMPRSSAGVAAAQPSAAQPPDHRKRKRDEASEDKADALFMMVLRKKYPKYVGRCMQEEFDSWLKHVAHGTGFRHDRRGDAYLGIPMDVVGNRDARNTVMGLGSSGAQWKRSVSQGAGIQLTLAPGVSPAGHQAFAYSVTFMALLAPRLLRGP